MPNKLKTISIKIATAVVEERLANAALSPGHILELLSTDKVKKHATARGAVTPLMVAAEDENQGNGINDAYAAADVVRILFPRAGDVVNVLLQDDQTIVIGDKLCSAGDGTVKKFTLVGDSSALLHDDAEAMAALGNSIIGIAREALDLSGSSGTESSELTGEQHIAMIVV